MDQEREEQKHRLYNRKKSDAAKTGWKRHHYNYMKGNRQKERDNMNKSFYKLSKEIEEALQYLDEAKVLKDDVFDLTYELEFENLSGGLALSIDKNGNVSFSTKLVEQGQGNYRLESAAEDNKTLYNNLKDELNTLANTIDENMKQILAKYGLRET